MQVSSAHDTEWPHAYYSPRLLREPWRSAIPLDWRRLVRVALPAPALRTPPAPRPARSAQARPGVNPRVDVDDLWKASSSLRLVLKAVRLCYLAPCLPGVGGSR